MAARRKNPQTATVSKKSVAPPLPRLSAKEYRESLQPPFKEPFQFDESMTDEDWDELFSAARNDRR